MKGCQARSQDFVDPADVAPGCHTTGESSLFVKHGLSIGFGSGLLQDPLLVLVLLLTLPHVLDASKWISFSDAQQPGMSYMARCYVFGLSISLCVPLPACWAAHLTYAHVVCTCG